MLVDLFSGILLRHCSCQRHVCLNWAFPGFLETLLDVLPVSLDEAAAAAEPTSLIPTRLPARARY